MIKTRIRNFIDKITAALSADEYRRKLLFIIINSALALVSLVMTIVNAFTGESILFCATLLYTVLCSINVVLIIKKGKWESLIHRLFGIEAMALICFFIVSGIPDGFSVQWICLIPCFSFLIFDSKFATRFSLVAFLMLIFLFWVPMGKALVSYDYNETFMLRFPFYYIAILLISYIADLVRAGIKNQLEETKQKYYYLYRHDNLTGLYNRFGIKEYIDAATGFKNSKQLAVLMMDIDDFKKINDTYGHQGGDEVLKVIANVPLDLMCEHSRYCRWGGEEFLMLMQCNHNPMEIAEKIRKEIEEQTIKVGDAFIKVTVSIGVAISHDKEVDFENIVDQADQALYSSKANGKNRVTLYG